MKDNDFYKRMADSAQDFVLGVQGPLEKQLRITVHPIEDLDGSELKKKLDQKGIDAIYYDEQGDMRGLASRMNYSSFARDNPAFTFRYRLWDKQRNCWDDNREYARKLHAANSPDEFIFFPKIHVESYSQARGSGLIGWCYAANTKDILNYIRENIDNPEKVKKFTPNTMEDPREVISVAIKIFRRDNVVDEIDCSKTRLD